MSTDSDLILSAIAAGTNDRAGIAEQTGLEPKTISNFLFALHKKGEIVKSANGWELSDAAPAKPNVHVAAEPVATAPTTAERGRKAKAKVKAKTASTPPRIKHANGAPQREIEFAIAESGAILFKITAGPRAGELGSINHVDAMALYRLMSCVDFITENA
jgi:hypothetical protein